MSVLSRTEAVALRVALACLRIVPPAMSSNIGGAVARAVGPMLPVSWVALDNLRAAMPALSLRERKSIVREVWENLGRTAAELPHLASLEQDTPIGPGWEISDPALIADLAARGGPAIFVTAHIGNWELLARAGTAYGISLSSMYRAAGNRHVDALINQLRAEATGARVPMFPKGAAGARRAAGHLARRGYLGLLVDQKLNEGMQAKFFGLPAMTTTAPAVFALHHRCPVIPIHVRRLGPARLRVEIEPPLPLPDTGNRQRDIAMLTQLINDTLENWIRRAPGSWLWLHRRWPKDVVRRSKSAKPGTD